MKITIIGTSEEIKALLSTNLAKFNFDNLMNHVGTNLAQVCEETTLQKEPEEVHIKVTGESHSSLRYDGGNSELAKRPLELPKPVEDKLNELYALVEKHPLFLPLPTVATFLGADADGLRSCIEKGQCPFGIGWQKDIRGYKAFKIPTTTFYLWYTQGVGYRQ